MSLLTETLYRMRSPEQAVNLEAEYRQLRRSMELDENGELKPALLIDHGWFDANRSDKKAVDPRSQLEEHLRDSSRA